MLLHLLQKLELILILGWEGYNYQSKCVPLKKKKNHIKHSKIAVTWGYCIVSGFSMPLLSRSAVNGEPTIVQTKTKHTKDKQVVGKCGPGLKVSRRN